MQEPLTVTSPAFEEEGVIPVCHTGYGQDISPELQLSSLAPGARSLAVIMDDLDHPIPAYNHWVIWNLAPEQRVPGDIPPGATLPTGAVQGRGYGKNRYRGPKPPFNWSHRYRYRVYVLDKMLDLPATTRKGALLKAMRGHVLQQGSLVGRYR